jgi:hypothetical protein
MNALDKWDQTRKVLYQTAPEFASMPMIRKYGCYAVALSQVMANVFRLPFDYPEALEFLANELIDDDTDIDNEMTVLDPQNFVDDIVGKGRVKFLGHFTPDAECPDDVLQFLCWHKTGKNYNHFTFGNGKLITLIDPWSPEGSESVRDGKVLSWRGYRLL